MKRDIYKYVEVLSCAGIALAVYLLWEQITQLPSVCSINATINCDAIISGPVSTTLGIPTPLYGLFGYIVIFLAAYFRQKGLMLAVATGGVAFCAWIAYQEIFLLHVICPVCILCQVIMLTVFTLALLQRKAVQ
ncbi:MAG: hypothetical protein QG621_291 [Patescibacteria group bacterium]|jgi:uncharacterized membrane protein|nr:hypothetical protein [Patescibacteria group bacterium]